MPTGYTCHVVDGKITEFPEFALSCARAFGALISMRDEPMDAPIPDEFKPSSYNETRLAESRAKLAELNAMTAEQVAERCAAAYAEARASHDKYEADCAEQDRRLDAMLIKVEAWMPPTAGHVEMKKFMIEQLTISKRGSYRPTPPLKMEPTDWHRDQIERAMKGIEYHAGEHAKEIERAKGRTEWLQQLRSSLVVLQDRGGQ